MSTSPQKTPQTNDEAPYSLGQHFDPATAPERAQLTVRRAPSIPAFAITGLIVGLLVALVVTLLGPENENFTFGAVYGVMAVIFGSVCTALFIVLALLLDRRSSKHLTVYSATSDES